MMRTRKGHKVYPLTVAQKFHLYYAPHCPSMAVLNIGTSLTIEVDLDWDQLKKSINEAYARNEGMRIRFAKDKEGNWYQYIVDPEEQDIEFVDFSNGTLEEAEAKMQEWTRVPFKMQDTQMSRVVMIKMPDGFNGVYFLGQHMTVDAQSLICFLKDIIELYCNAKYEGVPYPKEMCSYIEQLQKDLAYEAGSKAQQRDIAFFQKEIEKGEPIYNGIHGTDKLEAAREMFKNPELRTAFNASDDTTSALDIFHLEEEPTKRLMDFCEKYHVSLACLLLMGLRTYYQKMNGFEDVSVNNAIARRATLKEKKSGGSQQEIQRFVAQVVVHGVTDRHELLFDFLVDHFRLGDGGKAADEEIGATLVILYRDPERFQFIDEVLFHRSGLRRFDHDDLGLRRLHNQRRHAEEKPPDSRRREHDEQADAADNELFLAVGSFLHHRRGG